ncbi:MAG: tryptophan--tRNA ligase [Bacillota bacterium]
MHNKKVILSGIQPSGTLTLGNYIGALRNWAKLQNEYECYYCVVNMHALTVRQDPEALRKRSVQTVALLIALGIDPNASTIFIQSHVKEHAELTWVLCCNTYMGELGRMTQFKDKSALHQDNINAGLFTYPVLMAADILLYQSHLVPVGADQKQHIELARDLALRFNKAYGDTFVVPDPYIPKLGGRVMSLQDPLSKMSKSDANPNAYIALLDDADTITKKFKRAVTDCENRIAYDPERPGVANLLSIYCSCSDKTMERAVAEFEGKGYGQLKLAVAEAVIETLRPVQQEYARILADEAALSSIIRKGSEKARERAAKTVADVYEKVGLN